MRKSRSRERNNLPEVILPGLDLETPNARTLFSLRPRPLHWRGWSPSLLPHPTATTGQDLWLAGFQSHTYSVA